MVHYQTKHHHYNDDELISGLQKSIRRGLEEDALYFSLELGYESKSGMGTLLSRLKVIAYEDIGPADPQVVTSVSCALSDMEEMYKKQTGEWKMVLSYIILLLCRAKKSRISCNFLSTISQEWNDETKKRDIPDYAIDMHTTKGRKSGRKKTSIQGKTHFINQGSTLQNETEEFQDIYKKSAERLLLEQSYSNTIEEKPEEKKERQQTLEIKL